MKLIRSIYDKKIYQNSLTQKFSRPLFYWIGITILSFIIMFVSVLIPIIRTFPTLEELTTFIPEFEITNGILSIEERVEITETDVVIIIDDTYTFEEEDFRYVNQFFVATKESIHLKGEDRIMETIYYRDVDFLENTNKEQLLEQAKEFWRLIPISSIVVILLIFLVGFLFMASIIIFIRFIPILLWGLVGLLTAKIFKKNLTYSNSLKIVLYGSTLPIIFSTTYWVVYNRFVNIFLTFILVSIYTGYFISQLNTNTEDRETTEPIQEDTRPYLVPQDNQEQPTTEQIQQEPIFQKQEEEKAYLRPQNIQEPPTKKA